MDRKPTRIIIPQTGISSGDVGPRAIYDKTSSKVMEAIGEVRTLRASHVEPGSNLSDEALELLVPSGQAFTAPLAINAAYAAHWYADMTPTGHKTVLGPYPPDCREQALAAEVQWLQDNNIPVCERCRESPTARTISNTVPAEERLIPGTDIPDTDFEGLEERILEELRDDAARAFIMAYYPDAEVTDGVHLDVNTRKIVIRVPTANDAFITYELTLVFEDDSVDIDDYTSKVLEPAKA